MSVNFSGAAMAEAVVKFIDKTCLLKKVPELSITAYDVAKNFTDKNGDRNKGVAGIISILSELAKKGSSIANFPATMGINAKKMDNDIAEHGSVQASTITGALADTALAISVLPTPLAVPCAIAGALLTSLSWYLSADEERDRKKEQEKWARFSEFAKYLNSDEAQKYMNCPNCLNITISNPTVYENDGIAKFTITLDKVLEEDLTLKVFTVEGSATEDKDYTGIGNKKYTTIVIPAGTTEYEQSIQIIRDGKTENKEEFLLVVESSIYHGYDVTDITKFASGLGTIIDIEQETCPKPVTPTFSLNFPLPSSPSVYYPVYGGGGSSGGGLPIYGSGSSGSSSTNTTPTYIPQPDIPYIPCPDNLIENNSALVIKLNNTNSNLLVA